MTRRSPSQYDWGRALFDETWLTKHFTRRTGRRPRFVVRHHMTIIGTGNGRALDACYSTWQERQASAHYGVDGKLVRQYVRDGDNAWATGDARGNNFGLSIEHANRTAAPGWTVDEDTWDTGARLTATLHRVHRLGRPRRSTVLDHGDFRATECPGPYMRAISDKYLRRAQAYYDGRAPIGSTPTPEDEGLFGMSSLRTLTRRKATKTSERAQLPLEGTGSKPTSLLIPGKGALNYLATAALTVEGIPADREVVARFVTLDPKGKVVGSSGWVVIAGTSTGVSYGQIVDSGTLKDKHRLRVELEPRGLTVSVLNIKTSARYGR